MTWCGYCGQHIAPTQTLEHHLLTVSHLANEKKWRETIHACGHIYALHLPGPDGYRCQGVGCRCHPRFLKL